MTAPAEVRALFLACGTTAAELIAGAEVTAAWDRPSALEWYDVSGLAGHLARAVLTVDGYLARGPADAARLTDASGYLAAVLGDADPVDSDLHRTVRGRGGEAAADGPAVLAARTRTALERLSTVLDDQTLARPVAVLDGVSLPVEAYLRTRLVELVVHLDDLAVSVGAPLELPDESYRVVAGVLAETAARRTGGLATVRGLARRERHPDPIRAL